MIFVDDGLEFRVVVFHSAYVAGPVRRFVFFFEQKTAYELRISDWSSDVCSSDLVANLFVNFVSQPDIANLTHEQAGNYLTFLWAGMMVGRFLGAAIMQRVSAETLLAAFSIGAFIVMLVTVFAHGPVAMWSLILVGWFHSIMFPTIFALAIRSEEA